MFYSIGGDESTLHRKSQLVQIYGYLNKTTLTLQQRFAVLTRLTDGSAKTINKAYRKQLASDDISLAQAGNYSGDGAAVNSGIHGGNAVLFQKVQPLLIFTHCSGHKDALVAKDATDAVPIFKSVIELTEKTGRHYEASTPKVRFHLSLYIYIYIYIYIYYY